VGIVPKLHVKAQEHCSQFSADKIFTRVYCMSQKKKVKTFLFSSLSNMNETTQGVDTEMSVETTTEQVATQVETEVETIIQVETVTQVEETQPLTYSVFIPDTTQPYVLISSTADRYNDTVPNALKKDKHVMQQMIDPCLQSGNSDFFRNVKWSPDGTFLLTNSADDVIRLFQL
jgi:WD40 repeat protein